MTEPKRRAPRRKKYTETEASVSVVAPVMTSKPPPNLTGYKAIPRPSEYADQRRYFCKRAFALICGMNPGTITRHLNREGDLLRNAVVGTYWIDLEHPDATTFYQKALYKDKAGKRDRNNRGGKEARALPIEEVVGIEARIPTGRTGNKKKKAVPKPTAKGKNGKVRETVAGLVTGTGKGHGKSTQAVTGSSLPDSTDDFIGNSDLPHWAVKGLTHIQHSDGIIPVDHMTMREVAMRFHSMPEFRSFVDTLSAIAGYKDKEMKFLKARGDVLPKAVISDTILPFIDGMLKRLLGELPKSVTVQIVPLVMSEGELAVNAVEDLIKDEISRTIKGCKQETVKQLKAAEDRLRVAGGIANSRQVN